jgi:hypothetical protein
MFARVLSLLLLGFIVYGTTVEAAHTHAGFAGPANDVSVNTVSDPATETTATNTLPGCGDCLICQLHQHFSATLLSAPPSFSSSSLNSRFVSLAAVTVHSETAAPQRGRAPPSTF